MNQKNNGVTTTRLINTPVELVWKAWTDPTHLINWWGPNGFRNTFHVFDLKPAGLWEFTMHGPDGSDFPNTCQFVEIIRNQSLVFDHLGGMHKFRVTATFEKSGEKTQLSFRMIFDAAEEWEKVKAYVPKANEENFDRLETELKKMN